MKLLSLKNGFSRMLFWSVISAAFIGPGTVTTCSLAGVSYGTSLLWALTFSTLATIVLQEAAARVTMASSLSLGELMLRKHGKQGIRISRLLAGGVILGCAAYEAGNLLGAVKGLTLLLAGPVWLYSLLLGITAYLVLSVRNLSLLTRLLGLLVFVLGIAFLIVSTQSMLPARILLSNSLVPTIPKDSILVITGLVGTTIVPYNLFLGSGIGQGQSIADMRQGIVSAVLLGGIISMAILITGTLMQNPFSFENAAAVLGSRLGYWAEILFALGLFGAGFTSLVTAPFAASITARTLLNATETQCCLVWKAVLIIGVVFGILQFRPVPVILAAQVANGLLLPFITWQLYRCINDPALVTESYTNSKIQNIFLILIFLVTLFLGGNSILKVIQSL